MRHIVALLALALAAPPGRGEPALAARPKDQAPIQVKPAPALKRLPKDAAACPALPAPRAGPLPFHPGEVLTYDVDVMGMRASTLTHEVLARQGGRAPGGRGVSFDQIPVRVRTESNTFFSKIRRVKAEVLSLLRLPGLRPAHFKENMAQGERTRIVEVAFPSPGAERAIRVDWTGPGDRKGSSRHEVGPDVLDYTGAVSLLRAMPLKVGQTLCFDAYALRGVWRVQGKVEAREHVSVPAGEFKALRLSGTATRLGSGKPIQREIHLWISDDEYRLPLAAMGEIDLGPVRAMLASVSRRDLKLSPARPSGMEW